MTAARSPAQMTLEEWGAEEDDDEAFELVDGFLVEGPMPAILHESVIGWLLFVLGGWARTHQARVFPSGGKYGVGKRTGRLPDVTVFLRDRKRPPSRGLIRVAPSIVIEVVSPRPRDARRDRVEKLREYAAFGVPYYWLVDPELRLFEILELDATGHYRHLVSAADGVIEVVPGCEGLVLDVDALWREVDEVIAEGKDAEAEAPPDED